MCHLLIELFIEFGHLDIQVVLGFLQEVQVVLRPIMHQLGYKNLFLVVFVLSHYRGEKSGFFGKVFDEFLYLALVIIDHESIALVPVNICLTFVILK